MRTIFLTTILAAFLFATNLMAATPRVVTYNNTEVTAEGYQKEYITYDTATSKALSKTTYVFDVNGNMQNKTVYKWDDAQTWKAVMKYDYNYDNGQLAEVTMTKWDKKTNNWSEISKLVDAKKDINLTAQK